MTQIMPSAPTGSAVDVVRHDDGSFTVQRTFRSPAAAQRAVNDLLEICEPAFGGPHQLATDTGD